MLFNTQSWINVWTLCVYFPPIFLQPNKPISQVVVVDLVCIPFQWDGRKIGRIVFGSPQKLEKQFLAKQKRYRMKKSHEKGMGNRLRKPHESNQLFCPYFYYTHELIQDASSFEESLAFISYLLPSTPSSHSGITHWANLYSMKSFCTRICGTIEFF